MFKTVCAVSILLLAGCQAVPAPSTSVSPNPVVVASVNPAVDPSLKPIETRSYEDYTFIFQYPKVLSARDLGFEQLETIAGIDFPEGMRGKASHLSAPDNDISIFLLVIDDNSALKLTGPGALGEKAETTAFAGVEGVRTSFSTFRDGVAKHTLSVGILRERVFYQIGFLGTDSATMDDLRYLEALVSSTWKWKEGAVMVLPEYLDRPKLDKEEAPPKDCAALMAERDEKLDALKKQFSDFRKKKEEEFAEKNQVGSREYESVMVGIQGEETKSTADLLQKYPSSCP